MEKREIYGVIEALLFIWGDPLAIEDISRVLELDKKDTEIIISEMMDEFNYNRRGLQIIQINNKYQLATRNEHFDWIKKLCIPKKSKNLSNAALETLSIIGYKQPITKAEIEAIRGVKCDKALYTLIERNLIEEKGRIDKPGKPIIYGTTEEFLKHFGLKFIDELPNINNLTESADENIDEEK